MGLKFWCLDVQSSCKDFDQSYPVRASSLMFYLIKHIDAKATDNEWEGLTEVVWQYKNELDALDAADMYNTNLAAKGVPSWTCCYWVSS